MKDRLVAIIILPFIFAVILFAFPAQAFYARYAGYNNHGQGGFGNTSTKWYFGQCTVPDVYDFSDRMTGVAVGRNHMLLMHANGYVYGCGDNEYGQIGLSSSTESVDVPVRISIMPDDAKTLACGNNHSLVLMNNGDVYAFGRNDSGQLGLGTWTSTFFPEQTGPARSVVDIACGGDFSALLTHEGRVLVCGDNQYGQLSQKNTTDRNTWVEVIPEHGVDVECGQDFLAIRMADGRLVVCGRNNSGQLGLGDNITRYEVTYIPSYFNFKDHACGDEHMIGLSEGTIYTCGDNEYGQLGLGHFNDTNELTLISYFYDNVDVEAGGDHSFFVRHDGSISACGRNDHGQLGLSESASRSAPENVPGFFNPRMIAASRYNSAMIIMPSRPARNDYDGDGISDIAVYWPVNSGDNWYIRHANGTLRMLNYGFETTIPVSADYDGDGIYDIIAYSPYSGNWFIYQSTDGITKIINWGWEAAVPVPADYDGDGFEDVAVYSPADGQWYVRYHDDNAEILDFGWDEAKGVGAYY